MNKILLFALLVTGCGGINNPFAKDKSGGEDSAVDPNAPTAGTLACSSAKFTLEASDATPASFTCTLTGYSDPNNSQPVISLFKSTSRANCALIGGSTLALDATATPGEYTVDTSKISLETGDSICKSRIVVYNTTGSKSRTANFAIEGARLPGSSSAKAVVTVVQAPSGIPSLAPGQTIVFGKVAPNSAAVGSGSLEFSCTFRSTGARGSYSAPVACPIEYVTSAVATENVLGTLEPVTAYTFRAPDPKTKKYYSVAISAQYTSGTKVTNALLFRAEFRAKAGCQAGSYLNTATNTCDVVSCPVNSTLSAAGDCQCKSGYVMNGNVCQADYVAVCPVNSLRGPGNFAVCACKAGFQQFSGACVQSCPSGAARTLAGACVCTALATTLSTNGLSCEASMAITAVVAVPAPLQIGASGDSSDTAPAITVAADPLPTEDAYTSAIRFIPLTSSCSLETGEFTGVSAPTSVTRQELYNKAQLQTLTTGTYKLCVRTTGVANANQTANAAVSVNIDISTVAVTATMSSLYINSTNASSGDPFVTISTITSP